MGYSIAIRAENDMLLKKMIQFMEENYRNPHEIFGGEGDFSRLSDDLSYDDDKLAYGFDYNACEPERDYIFLICRWMAIKIGQKKHWKELGSVPHIVYDGYEPWPVLIDTEWKDKVPEEFEWCLVSSTGFVAVDAKYIRMAERLKKPKVLKNQRRLIEEMSGMKPEKLNKILENELIRLDELWSKYE